MYLSTLATLFGTRFRYGDDDEVLAPYYANTFDVGEDVDVTQGMLLRFGVSYVGYGICLLIGSTLLAGICYSMVKYYHKSPNRLRNTTLSDLKTYNHSSD